MTPFALLFSSFLLGCSSDTIDDDFGSPPAQPSKGDSTKEDDSKTKKRNEKKRSEIPKNLEQIRKAQLDMESSMGMFIAADPYPTNPGKKTQKWDPAKSGGFATMAWKPEDDVRGSYSISTTDTDFTIVGVSDVDGDGTFATYIATKSQAPKLITPEDVY